MALGKKLFIYLSIYIYTYVFQTVTRWDCNLQVKSNGTGREVSYCFSPVVFANYYVFL